MTVSVTLPKMGESVMEGTIIRWLKQEGEQVREDEPLVEISTDKIDTELPSPAAGVLKKIVVGPDQTVEVGTEIAVIDDGGEQSAPQAGETPEADEASGAEVKAAPAEQPKVPRQADAEPAENEQTAVEDQEEQQPARSGTEPEKKPEPKRAKSAPKEAAPKPDKKAAPQPGDDGARSAELASPLVRKLARERGVDVSTISGSGPGGRVTKEDVTAAAERGESGPAPQPAAQKPAAAAAPSRFQVPAEATVDVAFDRVRRAIAEHMTRSLQTAAQLTTVIEIDMTRVASIRQRAKSSFEQTEGFGLTFMPFVAAATVQALRAFPEFNAHIAEDGQTARLHRQVNMGIAVGRDEGLIVPVIHGADGMNLIGLARAINDVGTRARAKGQLKPDDITGGTFTLTNFGSFGGIIDTPIINQPQVAILGIGAITKRPAVITIDGADAIAIRQVGFFSLTYDHRWIDGHKAAQFNGRLKQILEEADFEKDLGL